MGGDARAPRRPAHPHLELIAGAVARLAAVSDSPREEARRLLACALGLARSSDLLRVLGRARHAPAEDPLTPDARARFRVLVERRAAGLPLQYVLGYADFYESRFVVRPGVFIPRPETEMLVDAVLGALPEGSPRVLELGTGSGALIVSVLVAQADAEGVGVDVSAAAREATEENARRLGVADRLSVHASDLFGHVPPERFPVVVSNPPYVAANDPLPSEVADHEPHEALYAGEDGLDVIRRIVADAPAWLLPGGYLVLEIGETQGERVRALLTTRGFGDVAIEPDLSGRDRMARGRWGG